MTSMQKMSGWAITSLETKSRTATAVAHACFPPSTSRIGTCQCSQQQCSHPYRHHRLFIDDLALLGPLPCSGVSIFCRSVPPLILLSYKGNDYFEWFSLSRSHNFSPPDARRNGSILGSLSRSERVWSRERSTLARFTHRVP